MRGPRLVDYPQLLVVGLNFFGDPFDTSAGWTEDNEIGRLWKRLMAFLKNHDDDIRHIRNSEAMLEIHVWGESATITGEFDVFVGLEVTAFENVPLPLVAKILPATTYAIFTLEDNEITGDWAQTIYHGWMRDNNYRAAHEFMIQWYDSRFKGLDQLAGSELDVYIPVTPISQQETKEPANGERNR